MLTYKTISLHTVGSYLYGLESQDSDIDYVLVYKREPLDYIALHNYDEYMPDKTLNEGQTVINYKYWDVKRFIRYVSTSNWQAFELLMAQRTHCNSQESQYLFSVLHPNMFSIQALAYQCLNVSNAKTMRAYMKMTFLVFLEYMLQYQRLPPTLNAMDILEAIEFPFTENVKSVFHLKRNGVKHHTFDLEINHTEYKNRIVKLPKLENDFDFDELFKKIVVMK